MTNMSKRELLDEVKPRYMQASRKEKGQILDEFCLNTIVTAKQIRGFCN